MDFDTLMVMDVLSFCSLHDRLYRGEMADLAQRTRLAQFSAQGDGKALNKVLAPFDELSGAAEKHRQQDQAKLERDLKTGKL